MDTYSEDEEDIRLVRLVLTGNHDAYRGLLRRYERGIYRFCLAYTNHVEEAEDAAQEIFIRAFVSLRTFSLERRFKTWLFAIAANHLRSRWRKTKAYMEKIRRIFISAAGESKEDPAEGAERSLAEEGVRKAVGNLPLGLRGCVHLYYTEGLSVEETAKALNLGTEAVKSRLFRARKLLRADLENLK